MATVGEVLKELKATNGIQHCLVVGRDGFVIDHVGSMEADMIGAVISTSIGAVEAMGRDMHTGALFEVMAEYNDGTVIAAPVQREAVLGIVAAKDASLGGIRFAVKKSLEQLERALYAQR